MRDRRASGRSGRNSWRSSEIVVERCSQVDFAEAPGDRRSGPQSTASTSSDAGGARPTASLIVRDQSLKLLAGDTLRMAGGHDGPDRIRNKGAGSTTRRSRSERSGALLAQIVDEFDQLDGLVVVLVGDRLPTACSCRRRASRRRPCPFRRIEERLLDRGLHVIGQIAEIGIGRVDDAGPDLKMIRKSSFFSGVPSFA